jgi:hypothetical protein
MMMTSRRWRVGQCAAVLTNLWLTALNQLAAHIRPVPGRCRAGSQTVALLDRRNVAEYLAVLPSRDARVIASARSGKLVCWIYAGPED